MKRVFQFTCTQCSGGTMTITIEFNKEDCHPCLENLTEGDLIDLAKKVLGNDTTKWTVTEIKEKGRR